MSEAEIRRYLAAIGRKGGKAGMGKSKVRGGAAYYKRISQLAARARLARRKETANPSKKKESAK